jgi:hypothetical protein
MQGPISLLKMMPHHMFIENLFKKSWRRNHQEVISWGFSGEEECMLRVLFTPSWVHCASSVNKFEGTVPGEHWTTWKTVTLHHSPTVLDVEWGKCDMEFNAHQTDMWGTPSCEEILLVLWCRLHSITVTMVSSSCLWRHSDESVEGNVPVSHRCLWTGMEICLLGTLQPGNCLPYSATALVGFPLQKPQMKCISAHSSFAYSVVGLHQPQYSLHTCFPLNKQYAKI